MYCMYVLTLFRTNYTTWGMLETHTSLQMFSLSVKIIKTVEVNLVALLLIVLWACIVFMLMISYGLILNLGLGS